MVVNVIKWRPRPPINSRKYEASITVRCLMGVIGLGGDGCSSSPVTKLTVEIRWKGSKGNNGLRAFSRRVKRNCTREELVGQNGVVRWDEEFRSVCVFSGYNNNKDGSFNPWEVEFVILNASDQQQKRKTVVAGPVVLNLAEFTSDDDEQELEFGVPLVLSSAVECNPSLCITLHLTELRTNQEPSDKIQRTVTMPVSAPLSPCFGIPTTAQKDGPSTLKKSLRKVKSLTEYVSSRRKSKKAYHGEGSSDTKFSTGSDNEYNYPFDTDSLDCSDEVFEESSDNVVQNSFGYGTLISANLAGEMSDLRKSCEDEHLVYYSNREPDDSTAEAPEQALKLSPKLGILAWKKRKLSFRSPKVRGEPLLKKEYGDSGGDDIDFDRRQLSSSDELSLECKAEESLSMSEFGDDIFAVGSWECKEVVSRDGCMKLQTQAFFATIDQRNEKAAGESACTALVAVIAHWLHSNPGEMPTRSEFDTLIREGSLQWRNLCEIESYMARFPDKHFDLETVIQAKIRPISVVGEKSFIGFFHPEGIMENDEGFAFLHGAMSFDNIWDEINRIADECATRDSEPLIYIVSWNDHFFVLKITADAYFVIDTLGERLSEGCNQAYVLKFDKDTTIESIRSKIVKPAKLEHKTANERAEKGESEGSINKEGDENEDVVLCKGKETCKEYIKCFLAAIPIRELQADIKKGRMGSVPLHHRLQVDFHHTVFLPTPVTSPLALTEADAV